MESTFSAAGISSPGLPAANAADPDTDEDLLVEEVSIDGMCGVY